MRKPIQIFMILANPFKPDPRVMKEAISLSQNGFRVTIIAWNRDMKLRPMEQIQNINIIRIPVFSEHGGGLKNLFKFIAFYVKALKQLLIGQPDIVHCHDLDTLFVGVVYKIFSRCRLLYDSHEYYSEMVNLPILLRKVLAFYEYFCLCASDAIIVASTFTKKKFDQAVKRKCAVINNSADTSLFGKIDKNEIELLRSSIGVKQNEIMILYVGGFSEYRKILELIDSSVGISNLKIVIAGDMGQSIVRKFSHHNHIIYMGWIKPSEVPLFTKAADVCYYVYDIASRYANYVNPNALFNALAAGKGIICSDCGDMGEIVRETKSGFFVNPKNISSYRLLLKDLTKDQLIRKGQFALCASKSKYSWAYNEKKLLNIYDWLYKKQKGNLSAYLQKELA